MLILCAGHASARDASWRVYYKNGDLLASKSGKRTPAFSARQYAQMLADDFRLDTKTPDYKICSIEIDLEALSLLGDALSLEVTDRRLPAEDCARMMGNSGSHGLVSVRLGSAALARVDDDEKFDKAAARVDNYVKPQRLLQKLRKTRAVVRLIGAKAASAQSLQALFERLEEATFRRPDERSLSPRSLQRFYVARASAHAVDLRIAWTEERSNLPDKPRLRSLALPLHEKDLKKGVVARALHLPAIHLRFISPD